MSATPSDLSMAAAFNVGRLSMAVERSPLRPLWLSHETARVVATLFSRGVEPMSPDDLLILGAGLAGGTPSIGEAAARRFWTQALRLWKPRVAAEPVATIPEVTKTLARLAHGDIPPGDLALEAPMRMAAVTGWALPSVALALPPSPSGVSWEEAFLKRLALEAASGLDRLVALERDYGRWLSRLPETRSDSRLRDAVVLLGTMHALTPRYVVEALGLTRQAAARLLRRLETLGIIRQGAERQRWLIYVAENVGPAALVPEITSDTRVLDPSDLQDIDRVLDAAYRVLDRSMRRDGA